MMSFLTNVIYSPDKSLAGVFGRQTKNRKIMKLQADLTSLINYAVKAPSGHNTQPWTFRIEGNTIEIHPDLSRALPVVDTDNHALYISLGCAAENIVIAAAEQAKAASVNIIDDGRSPAYLSITVDEAGSAKPGDLFRYIEFRQCTKNKYEQRPVSDQEIGELKMAVSFTGIGLMMFTTPEEINRIRPFIIEGSNRQFKNRQFVNELVSWIRFSKREATHKRDGVWGASMGMPGTGRLLGSIVMKKLVGANSEAKRWHKMIDATAGLALFTAKENDTEHWVKMGRAFQRFGLTATKLNISHAHVNMPCEEPEVRYKMAEQLGLENRHPLLLIRFGYSEKMPYSFRRAVEDVIVN